MTDNRDNSGRQIPPKTSQPANRKRRNWQEVRHAILEAAGAEFREKGYHDARTAAIARGASATESQIFRHFGNKRGLFREAVFDKLNDFLIEFAHDYLAGLERARDEDRDYAGPYVAGLAEFLDKNAQLIFTLLSLPPNAARNEMVRDEISGLRLLFDRCEAVVTYRLKGEPRLPVDLAVRFAFATVLASTLFREGLFQDRLRGDPMFNEHLTRFLLDGFSANDVQGKPETSTWLG